MPRYTVRIRLHQPTPQEIELLRNQISPNQNPEERLFGTTPYRPREVNEWLCFETSFDNLFTAHNQVRNAVEATGKDGSFTVMRRKRADSQRYSLDYEGAQN